MFKFGTPLCLALVALTSAGCHPPSSKIPLEQLDAGEQPEPTGEARQTVEALPVEQPADLLPAEVAVLVEAIDPTTVLGLIGPLDKYPELADVRSEIRARIGADLLDPTQWSQLGIDSHGRAGFGVFDVGAGAGFGYLTLVDEQKFEQAIHRILDSLGAREQLSSMEVGSARVYRLGREASIVVRDRVALLIYVQDPDQAPRDYVVTAATMDPREGLGRSERFSWARQQVVAADDGVLFVNPSELLRQIASGQRDRDDDYGIRYAEDALAQARASNEPPERIREHEARLAEERRWQQERAVRAAGEQKLAEALFGSIHAFIGAVDVRDAGMVGHGRALMPGPNLLRRVFLAPERESPLLTALSEPPMFVLDGRADLQVALEIVGLLATADGESLDTINAKIQGETGVDVIGGLIPALNGEGGIAVTQASKPDFNRIGDLSQAFGVAGHLGLRDPEAIRQLLDQLARNKQLGGALSKAKRGDGWQLALPDWHDVALSIVGDRLIFATDGKFAARVRDAERGTKADAIASTEHPLRGPLPSPAARMYAQWSGIIQLDARAPYQQDAESMLYDFNTHATLTPEEAAKVPRSKAYKKKLAELEKLVAEHDAVNAKQAKAAFERDLAFAESLGDYGMQVEVLTDGLGLTGQWRFAAGMTPLELFAKAIDADRSYDWTEIETINSRMYTVVDELRAIRQADLDTAANSRKPN